MRTKALIKFYDLTKKKKSGIKMMGCGEHLARKSWREKCMCALYVYTNNSALKPRCPLLVGKTAGAFARAMHSGMHRVADQRCNL